MKRIVYVVLVSIMLAAPAAHASWYGPAPDPNLSGVLVEVQGPVTITAKGKAVTPSAGAELKSGTSVRADKGGNATVMLANSTIVKVASNETYIVGSQPRKEERKTVVQGIAIALNEAAKVKIPAPAISDIAAVQSSSSPRVRGMVKMGQVGRGTPQRIRVPLGQNNKKKKKSVISKPTSPEAIYPVNTAIRLPKEMIFRWKHKATFAEPAVAIKGTRATRVTIGIPPKPGTEARASSKIMGLKKGESYTWYLASHKDDGKKKYSSTFAFSILGDEKARTLSKDLKAAEGAANTPAGKALMAAQVYYGYGMYHDMVEALLPTYKAEPSLAAKNLLKLGYAKMKMYNRARKYQ